LIYRSNVDEKGVVREDYGMDRDMQPFASVIGIYLLVSFFHYYCNPLLSAFCFAFTL
jgi:hypothetical protein